MLKRSLIVLAICWTSGLLSAGIIFSNIGAGFPGDTPAFHASGSGGNLFVGTTFTTSGTGNLLSISTELAANPTSTLSVGLYTNSSGEPGTLLESWSIIVPIYTGSLPPLTTFASVLNPSLSSGTQYWFVVTTTNNTINWAQNDKAVNGGLWSSLTSLSTLSQVVLNSPTPGIQLDSTPEPVSGLLLATGTLLLMVVRRFSKT